MCTTNGSWRSVDHGTASRNKYETHDLETRQFRRRLRFFLCAGRNTQPLHAYYWWSIHGRSLWRRLHCWRNYVFIDALAQEQLHIPILCHDAALRIGRGLGWPRFWL